MDGVTLDTLIVDSGGRIPLPDFLSLDTQGSELEILSGSPHATGSALAVVCEVEFLPLYRGQCQPTRFRVTCRMEGESPTRSAMNEHGMVASRVASPGGAG